MVRKEAVPKKKTCAVKSVPGLLYYFSIWYRSYDRVTVGSGLFFIQ